MTDDHPPAPRQTSNDRIPEIAIGRAYDVLVHLHTVREVIKL
ncbi:hypothetical protein [Kitasatospora aureofaciens]|nr:hypothetical protein [Kitasatospora aureofaciens]